MRVIGTLTSWFRKEEGSVAVEFSLLVVPFVFLIIGIMEICLMFASNSVLDGATQEAARMVRTGQIQQARGNPEEMFSDRLCEKASVLIDCGKLQYEVIEMPRFADFGGFPPSFDEDGNLEPQGFGPGGVNSVNLVRVIYRHKLATPLIAQFLADGPGNTRLMISTVVLQTEPYDITQVDL